MEIKIEGISTHLLPEKALFFAEDQTMVVGDVHLGKATHFRKSGIALPYSPENDLLRLQQLLNKTKCKRIIFLGDLFHSSYNAEWDEFILFRQRFPEINFHLIIGNHDVLNKQIYHDAGIEISPELILNDKILLTHDEENTTLFNIHGHVHPGIKIRGKGRQSIVLPSYVLYKKRMIIPAFGKLTGKYILNAGDAEELYVVSESKVWKLNE
jgi:DNA ligase-associated metallophosphoesterase